MWLAYLVYNIDNCVIKLCIETGLTRPLSHILANVALAAGSTTTQTVPLRALKIHDSIIESKTINHILFTVFC